MIGVENNKVLSYAANVRAIIESGKKPDGSPLGDVEALERGMAIEVWEYVAFQETKSWAQLMGILSLDEAMTVYAALGGEMGSPDNGGWGSGTDLAMKVTVTTLMGQLVAAKRRSR